MGKEIKRTNGGEAEDRLTPFEVALLSRVVRAHVIPEADLVSSWGMGPWAAPALDGLLKRELVSRREEVSQFGLLTPPDRDCQPGHAWWSIEVHCCDPQVPPKPREVVDAKACNALKANADGL